MCPIRNLTQASNIHEVYNTSYVVLSGHTDVKKAHTSRRDGHGIDWSIRTLHCHQQDSMVSLDSQVKGAQDRVTCGLTKFTTELFASLNSRRQGSNWHILPYCTKRSTGISSHVLLNKINATQERPASTRNSCHVRLGRDVARTLLRYMPTSSDSSIRDHTL